jgi:DNA-directed RNA polymerase subunit M/transcription elongation factor TFIIS
MFCKKCGSRLLWAQDFSELVCSKCGKRHDPIEIRDRMWKKESEFKQREKDDGKMFKIKMIS